MRREIFCIQKAYDLLYSHNMDTSPKQIIRWYGRFLIVILTPCCIFLVLLIIFALFHVFQALTGQVDPASVDINSNIGYAVIYLICLAALAALSGVYFKRIVYKGTTISQTEGTLWRIKSHIDLTKVVLIKSVAKRASRYGGSLYVLELTDDTGKEFDAPLWAYGGELLTALAEPLRTMLLNPNIKVDTSEVSMQKVLRNFYKNIPENLDEIIANPNRSPASAPEQWVTNFSANHGMLIGILVIAIIIIVGVATPFILKAILQP